MAVITCVRRKRAVTEKHSLSRLRSPGDIMETRYWISRKRAAMTMARGAVTAEARLIHYDLAGRYSVKAAQCLLLAAPATVGQRAALRPPEPQPRPQAPVYSGPGREGS